jgi:lactoylglutathione lyase
LISPYKQIEIGCLRHLIKIEYGEGKTMRFLHTMVRVHNLEQALDFYCYKLGFLESQRYENEAGRFTLVYLYAASDVDAKHNKSPLIELTYNWDDEVYLGGRNFGHLAFEVDNIYQTCQNLIDKGVTINRPPRDGYMAFIKSPDGISIELLQRGEPLSPREPWASMDNTGSW